MDKQMAGELQIDIENKEIYQKEWYQSLIDDCKSIITEAVFTSRWALVEGYWNLGERIDTDINFKKYAKGNYSSLQDLAKNLETSERTLYYSIQFYRTYPDINTLPEGKNITWNKLITKYLPKGKEKPFQFDPKVYNIWNFAGRNPNFGFEYPGNIPGEIALNVIYYYTQEGDLIVDPMAGGGSTIDACKFLNRKCLAYDINCVREDIKYNDVTKGFPEEAKDCDLIFLDPPYYNLKAKDYIPESVSSLEINKFRKFVDNLAKDCYEIIKEKGMVTYLIQNYYVKFASIKEYIDFIDEGIQSFKQAGFKLVNRINCPQTSQVYQPQDVKKAQDQKGMLNLVRDLMIFQK